MLLFKIYDENCVNLTFSPFIFALLHSEKVNKKPQSFDFMLNASTKYLAQKEEKYLDTVIWVYFISVKQQTEEDMLLHAEMSVDFFLK